MARVSRSLQGRERLNSVAAARRVLCCSFRVTKMEDGSVEVRGDNGAYYKVCFLFLFPCWCFLASFNQQRACLVVLVKFTCFLCRCGHLYLRTAGRVQAHGFGCRVEFIHFFFS